MKVRGFQAKWPMLVLVSKDSFSKWSHFVQMGAYWNGQQVCPRKFSFLLHENSIFHFSSAKSRVVLWRTYQIVGVNLNHSIFVKYGIIWENYPLKLAITLVIWLESHESSYSIAHFEKTFLRYLHYSKFVCLYG